MLRMMILFHELFAAVGQPYTITGDPNAPITAPVVESNRDVQPGGVFVARGGMSVDGHNFIADALARGAAGIVGERDPRDLSADLGATPYARVPDPQAATGFLAAAYHRFPSRDLIVIGVTGTDGKTTTSTLIHSILKAAFDGKAGLISTIAADLGGATVETGLHVTTPSAPQIQALLAQMRANGIRHVVVEMTSHGLAQGRLNGVDIDIAVLTNLTHEHLDYHGTFEAYRAAKGRMFAMLSQSARKPDVKKVTVVNADDPNADFFAAFPADRVLRYSMTNPVTPPRVDFKAADVIYRPEATQFALHHDNQTTLMQMALVGAFNVANGLAAISAARACGVPMAMIQRGLMDVTAIPGRLERIDAGQDYLALVDFAHTPNALRNALTAARGMVGQAGRVIVVFGCAGLRDREKRQMMPELAIQLADRSIFTAEDPRTESLDAILETMTAAARAAGGIEGEHFWRVLDRGRALLAACEMARAGDVVIACGKGHEQSMAFGTTEYAWDDRAALRTAIGGAAAAGLPTA
jgi:UDP-N-acetylmuramoyl-L-alanyl-D-glutamate--2,6-diaminopimelate ligase